MTSIKTFDTLVLWPTSICASFYDLPANQVVSGNYNFTLEFDFQINAISGERGSIISINPNYFTLHYYNERISAFHLSTDNKPYHNIHQDLINVIKLGQRCKIRLVNVENTEIIIYINDKQVTKINQFSETKDPQIFLGSETFPNGAKNINSCDMDLYEFKLHHNNELICHHDFNNIIHDKFVDLTNNCNFIHKI